MVLPANLCPRCGEPSLVSDITTNSGNLTCSSCGTVVHENPIVSEVSFGENASGGAVVQGTMVGSDQARVPISGRQNAMESRDQTMLTGRRNIKDLAASLNIPDYISDAAHGWFKLALNTNFVQGRRSQNVTAACLYIACRKEKTSHLLIDFSSRLQISVFSLGATFLKMVRTLNITKLPLVDPSLFISHFAERLNLDREKPNSTNQVISDAIKISFRMAKDSIVEGRRPAGVAGACVMMALRMNGFQKDPSEIVAIAHVSSDTLQARMDEFKRTSSGKLRIREFRDKSEQAEAAMPPSYTRNRERSKKANSRHQLRLASVNRAFEYLKNPPTAVPKDSTGSTQKPTGRLGSLNESASKKPRVTIRPAAVKSMKKTKDIAAAEGSLVEVSETDSRSATTHLETSADTQPQETDSQYVPQNTDSTVTNSQVTSLNTDSQDEDYMESRGEETISEIKVAKDAPSFVHEMASLGFNPELLQHDFERYKDIIEKGYSLDYPEPEPTSDSETADKEEEFDPNKPQGLVKYCKPSSYYLDLVSSSADLDDVELTEAEENWYLNSDEMAKAKEQLWLSMNKDYLLEQERKRLKAETDELTGNTSGKKKRRKTKADREKGIIDETLEALTGEPRTPADSVKQMMQRKTFSKKINYDALDNSGLFL
ncbi:transcription factor TFIIIB subunit brf1 [Yamadazyma tenuis]|uniref:transcription factor TFIIIB subunit brf1 n=1 Tax=Candida tenuis TaxID=2315449 RepID=UPI0027988E7E|nr:transcription factor TFIIIB subunit brf1 [Yamadazyma tenuis]